MNYNRIYSELIAHAKQSNVRSSEYYETHHIVPKCLGGIDDKTNLVDLTPEQHFVAHLLLVKMHKNNQQLLYAVNMMGCGFPGKRTRKIYGWIKRRYIEQRKLDSIGAGNNQHGTVWITDGCISKKVSSNSPIPEGWKRGRVILSLRKPKEYSYCDCGNTKSKQASRCKPCASVLQSHKMVGVSNNNCKGKVFITDGITDKMLIVGELVPDGWRFGRSTNHNSPLV
jgi:hypothetical protein